MLAMSQVCVCCWAGEEKRGVLGCSRLCWAEGAARARPRGRRKRRSRAAGAPGTGIFL